MSDGLIVARTAGVRIAHVLAHDLLLFLPVGVIDPDLQHEPVHLRFRQRIRPFLLDRILRCQNHERLFQWKRLIADRDLLFLHGLKQRALHLCGRAVDFVGQDEIGENRPLANA